MLVEFVLVEFVQAEDPLYLKPNEIVKSSIVTLYMTFERILKDFKVSYLAKTQVLPIAFAQVLTTSQLYSRNWFKGFKNW